MKLEERMRVQAEALIQERQRTGKWSGGIKAHVEYQRKPLEWIVEKLGVPEKTIRWSLNPGYTNRRWDGDVDPLVALLEALADWHDVGCEAGTGTGKTYLAACIVYWWLACFEDSIVSTIAPKEQQLLQHIWKEIGKLWPKFNAQFPQAELLTGVIRMKPAQKDREVWAASAFVCGVGASEEVATKAQGLHAEHLLIITEETPGIHPAIMNALYNTRTDDHNLHLGLGNPDHRQDELHRFCMTPGVVHVRMSALDHPNIVTEERIVPGAIGLQRLEARTIKLGLGSRLYESRVRGISPAESEDALIRWDWCVAAHKKYDDPAYRKGPPALGVDVANSEHGDPAAIARWQGACLTEVPTFQCPDASELGKRVVLEARDPRNPVEPRHVGVDSVGVGASTVNKMRELGFKARDLSGGTRAIPRMDTDLRWSEVEPDLEGNVKAVGPTVIEAERFDNLISQIRWRLREDLRLGNVALPHDEELWQDLCTPTYTTKGGKICVETKEAIIKRLGHSPNKGDAAAYGNFVRSRVRIRTKASEPEMISPRNRDYGLEKRLAAHRKLVVAEERRIRRMFNNRARARRRNQGR